MEVNEQNTQALTAFLAQTLNPGTRKQAEKQLQSYEGLAGFPILVLNVVGNEAIHPSTRTAAVLLFKNYVKRNWDSENGGSSVTPADRRVIKERIVDLMIKMPSQLQVQLGEAIALIAESDFPKEWETLIQELVAKLSPDDYKINNGILQTAHSIFKRWRKESRSDDLYSNIIMVLGQFSAPWFELLKNTDALIDSNSADPAILKTLSLTMHLLVKIFLSLNYHDLPPFFEDNMEPIFGIFHKYLLYSNPVLDKATEDMEEGGPAEKIKGAICEVVVLYNTKYDEDFELLLPKFVETIWGLLVTLGPEERYDVVVSKSMMFLTSVIRVVRHKNLFSNTETLVAICEKICLPNLVLHERDIEMSEDEPIPYVQKELEGSETGGRRKAAIELIRGMMELFEQEITTIMAKYVFQYLQSYSMNPQENWKDKDTAVTLLSAIAARKSTQQHGVRQTNEAINVVEFFSNNVLGDLHAGSVVHPILKADAIKFLLDFRNELTKEQLREVFPLLVDHLSSTMPVVHTMAAVCIERVLFIKRDSNFIFSQADIKPFAPVLLPNLFKLLEANETPEKVAENDYLMKAVMRVIIMSRTDIVPYVETIIEKLTNIVKIISKNPSNPKFSHYVFESISALIRYICGSNPALVDQFETRLWPACEEILTNNIDEFMPYVFQILSQMLEYHSGGIPPAFERILPFLLQPTVWEQHGNIPALVRLMTTYIRKDPAGMTDKLQPMLGIFQKLIASQMTDHLGFDLLDSILLHMPLNVVEPYLKPVITLILTRLQAGKMKFTKNFVQFVGYFLCIEHPTITPDYVVQAFDELQPGLFKVLLQTTIIPEIEKGVQWMTEKKTCAVGYTKLLAKSRTMLSDACFDAWPSLLSCVLTILEERYVDVDEEEQLKVFELEETGGYSAGYSKLAAASRLKDDPAAKVLDPRRFLVDSIMEVQQKHPKIQMAVQPPALTHGNMALLQSYMSTTAPIS